MSVAALLGWLVSAGLGLRLLSVWADAVPGRVRRNTDVLGYAGALIGGVLVWLCAMMTGWIALEWLGLLLLLTTVLVGERLFRWWFPDRESSRLPALVVYAHGSCTVMTLALALLACLGM